MRNHSLNQPKRISQDEPFLDAFGCTNRHLLMLHDGSQLIRLLCKRQLHLLTEFQHVFLQHASLWYRAVENRGFREGIVELLLAKALKRTGGAFLIVSAKPGGVCIFIESVEHKDMTLLAFRFSFGGAVFRNDGVFLVFRYDRHIVLQERLLLIVGIEITQIRHQIVDLQSFDLLHHFNERQHHFDVRRIIGEEDREQDNWTFRAGTDDRMLPVANEKLVLVRLRSLHTAGGIRIGVCLLTSALVLIRARAAFVLVSVDVSPNRPGIDARKRRQ